MAVHRPNPIYPNQPLPTSSVVLASRDVEPLLGTQLEKSFQDLDDTAYYNMYNLMMKEVVMVIEDPSGQYRL